MHWFPILTERRRERRSVLRAAAELLGTRGYEVAVAKDTRQIVVRRAGTTYPSVRVDDARRFEPCIWEGDVDTPGFRVSGRDFDAAAIALEVERLLQVTEDHECVEVDTRIVAIDADPRGPLPDGQDADATVGARDGVPSDAA